MRSKKVQCCDFARNRGAFRLYDGMGDGSNHPRAVAERNSEYPIETTLGELPDTLDVMKALAYCFGGDALELIDIEMQTTF